MSAKLALFRIEASNKIGAGHAIRSTVLADALVASGWECKIIASITTYYMIKELARYTRIDPQDIYAETFTCDLLVIDNYDIDVTYEKHWRTFAKKIMVIDDLANREHDCDLILDQTMGRKSEDYTKLVPNHCKILTGTDYILLRENIVSQRIKAIEKRNKNRTVKRILISMGGGGNSSYILKALELIKEVEFQGSIDVVLGFVKEIPQTISNILSITPNECTIHADADMVRLMLNADLAIGGAGSSVWERACLGLPQYIMQTSDNQTFIAQSLAQTTFKEFYMQQVKEYSIDPLTHLIDGFGCVRAINHIDVKLDKSNRIITHRKIKLDDLDLIFKWVQDPEIRKFSFNSSAPTYAEHVVWFAEKINDANFIFEMIFADATPCGTLRLDNINNEFWKLSWYIIPEYQGYGIGTITLGFAKKLIPNMPIKAEVFNNNLASHAVMHKSDFKILQRNEELTQYVY